MLAVAAMMNFGMMGVFALRIVFLVRTDGAMPGTAGILISLGSPSWATAARGRSCPSVPAASTGRTGAVPVDHGRSHERCQGHAVLRSMTRLPDRP
jgi:hypothetical protein